MSPLHADALFDGLGWHRDCVLHGDGAGGLHRDCVLHGDGADGLDRPRPASGAVAARAAWVVPGIANLHSHAFQRAMAGLAERQQSDADSFWTWRDWMYRFAARLAPEDVQAIARQLYIEMLEAGYTSVCEFHYLHHDVDGRPYARPAAMAEAILAAAQEAGIRLTLLPVLYQRGGFDGRPLAERQRRFAFDSVGFVRLVEDLKRHAGPTLRIGIAFHSLRAVDAATMREVLAALDEPGLPVHVHVAEQQAEVADCLAAHGRRPVQHLLDELPVDARWTLVHATHLDDAEVLGIARSGATVALCPSTEGNLGDGLFPLRAFLAAGGRYGIGSDSQVSVSPVEELRWLEYGQRLVEQKRSRALLGAGSTGEAMLRAVADSAAAATGQPVGRLAAGFAADLLVLDEAAPALAAAGVEDALDRWLFCGNRPLPREVFVAGRRVVAEGRHPLREPAARDYAATLRRLLGSVSPARVQARRPT
jgi:formimidoylglutamate deiminase